MFPNHENGRYSVSEDGTLRIRDVQYEDEGQYVCQGLNVLGSEKALATITVKGETLWGSMELIHNNSSNNNNYMGL